jgi:hypothetical protein
MNRRAVRKHELTEGVWRNGGRPLLYCSSLSFSCTGCGKPRTLQGISAYCMVEIKARNVANVKQNLQVQKDWYCFPVNSVSQKELAFRPNEWANGPGDLYYCRQAARPALGEFHRNWRLRDSAHDISLWLYQPTLWWDSVRGQWWLEYTPLRPGHYLPSANKLPNYVTVFPIRKHCGVHNEDFLALWFVSGNCQYLRLYSGGCYYDRWVINWRNLDRSGRDVIELLSSNLPGGTEENSKGLSLDSRFPA